MLHARRDADDVALPHLLNGTSPALNPAATCGDNQHLAERMSMPRGTCAGGERDRATRHARRWLRSEQRRDTYRTREVFGWCLLRRLRAAANDDDRRGLLGRIRSGRLSNANKWKRCTNQTE